MKRKLLNNLGLKIAAVLLAVVTWLYVINAENPSEVKTIEVPINVLNENVISEAGYAYEFTSSLVADVQVKAKRLDMDAITADDFYLSIDLDKKVGSDELQKSCNISMRIVSNSDIIEEASIVSGLWIDLVLEPVISVELPVEVVTVGTPADDYTTLGVEPTATPSTITLTGRQSAIEQVYSAQVSLNIEGATLELDETCTPQLLDRYGVAIEDVSNITVSPETVQVVLPIMKTKKVPLVYTVQGEPADGYRVTEVTSSVSTVTLAGYQAMLEGITSVTIDSADLDVSDLTEQKQFEVNLTDYLPEGISIYGSEEAIITVDVEALEQRTFKLTLGTEVEILNKNAGLLYNFSTDSVNLQIIGLPEDLNSLSVSTIIASANMSGLGEGTHQVVVDITLPDALTLATPVTTVVTITAPTEAPTTTAEDAEASSEETETSGESTTENGTEESQ